jgi:hypothetical protein
MYSVNFNDTDLAPDRCHLGQKYYYYITSILSIYGAGVEPSPLLLRPFIGLLH